MSSNDPAVSTTAKQSRVLYMYSPDYARLCSSIEKEPNRSLFVHLLIHAYGLFDRMQLRKPKLASEGDLLEYHSSDYVAFLANLPSEDSLAARDPEFLVNAEEFGLSHDCPIKPNLFSYVRAVAGATLAAASALISGSCDVAINWGGGWHHARAGCAAGFCYVNDCVLGILRLQQRFKSIMYIDVDAHHCDAVEDAFSMTGKVMTVSFHKYEPGFFPCTGGTKDVGEGRGKDYALNVPLRQGITDDQFIAIVARVTTLARSFFKPDCLVIQCGADCTSGDPIGAFNLTPYSLVTALKTLQGWELPILLLGGGGYNKQVTSKCWAQLTAAVVGVPLSSDIPEHSLFPLYGPDFQLAVEPGRLPNFNSEDYLNEIMAEISLRYTLTTASTTLDPRLIKNDGISSLNGLLAPTNVDPFRSAIKWGQSRQFPVGSSFGRTGRNSCMGPTTPDAAAHRREICIEKYPSLIPSMGESVVEAIAPNSFGNASIVIPLQLVTDLIDTVIRDEAAAESLSQ